MEPEQDPEQTKDSAAEDATVVKCEACGAENPEDAETCRSCGRALETEEDEAEEEEGDAAEGGGLAEWRGLLLIGGVFAAVIAAWFLLSPSKSKAPATAAGTSSTSSQSAAAAQKPENEVKEIEIAGDTVWVGTSKGLFGHDRKTGEQKQVLNATNGLLQEFVDSIVAARDGKLWIGSFGGGVNVWDGTTWVNHDANTTGGKTVIYGLQDKAGKFWFCTSGAGLFVFDGSKWTSYTRKTGLPDDEVHVVAQDQDGSMWVGTSLGVAHLKDGKWKVYRTADGLANDKVLAIVVDGQGNKWFGTWGGGLSRFDGSQWKTYGAMPEGPRSAFVLSARVDGAGHLWFGTHDGVSTFDGSSWTHFAPGDGLLGGDVYAIEIDNDGQKWFGTYKGLSRLGADNKEWKQFPH